MSFGISTYPEKPPMLFNAYFVLLIPRPLPQFSGTIEKKFIKSLSKKGCEILIP